MENKFEFVSLVPEEKDDGQRVEVEITVSAADVDALMDEFYQLMARVRGIKAETAAEAQEKLEEQIKRIDLNPAMRDYLLNRFTKAAVLQLDMDTVLAPGVHAETIPERGQDYTYSINLIMRPEVKLSSYEPVVIEKKEILVTDQDIDEQVRTAARQTLTYEKADHKDLREGDFALMDVEMFVNGNKLNKLSGAKMRIEIARGQVPDGFIEGVVGMEPVEIKKLLFDVEVPLAKEGEDRYDHYKADVTLWEVQKQIIPEVDDAWVQRYMPEYKNLAGFRNYIRETLEEQKSKVDEQSIVYSVREALEGRLIADIPDIMYEEAKDSLMRRTLEQLEEQGLSLEDYCEQHGTDKATFNMNLFMQSSSLLRQNLALDALAEERGLDVTDDEIREARKKFSPAMAKLSDKEFEDRGYKKSLAENLRRKKAIAWLIETAEVE